MKWFADMDDDSKLIALVVVAVALVGVVGTIGTVLIKIFGPAPVAQ